MAAALIAVALAIKDKPELLQNTGMRRRKDQHRNTMLGVQLCVAATTKETKAIQITEVEE
jgi:hypothetical protein